MIVPNLTPTALVPVYGKRIGRGKVNTRSMIPFQDSSQKSQWIMNLPPYGSLQLQYAISLSSSSWSISLSIPDDVWNLTIHPGNFLSLQGIILSWLVTKTALRSIILYKYTDNFFVIIPGLFTMNLISETFPYVTPYLKDLQYHRLCMDARAPVNHMFHPFWRGLQVLSSLFMSPFHRFH